MLSFLAHVKIGFDIFTFFLFGYINNSCLVNRIASSSLSYTVAVAPSSLGPWSLPCRGVSPVWFSPGPQVAISVVIGTTASQSGKRQMFRCLASHGTPYLPHSTYLLIVTRSWLSWLQCQLCRLPCQCVRSSGLIACWRELMPNAV